MNYTRIYDQLILRAKNRILTGEYYESHHIIPRCMHGTNELINLVNLTPEEHYVAHQLLVKMYPDNPKLIFAAFMMSVSTVKMERNNKLYGWIKRKRFANPMPQDTRDKISKSLTGCQGTQWSEETRRILSVPNIKKANYGDKNGFYNKSHTEETLKILSEKCGIANKGKSKSKETIKNMIASFDDHRRKMLSDQRSKFNLAQSESHKEATRLSNINRGIFKQKTIMIKNLESYTSIFSDMLAGKDIKVIAKELNMPYGLIWKIKNKFDYFYPIYIDVLKNISSDSNNISDSL